MQLQKHSEKELFGRYYTNKMVCEVLVKAMNLSMPKLVIDLGVGCGALSTAAAQTWISTEFITVDIDNDMNNAINRINSTHHVCDVLNSQLHKKIGLSLGTVDGAICNPPYTRPAWRSDFVQILEEAGLSKILESVPFVGADILFVAQNLRFLRSNGRLGLILPDGLISGERFIEFRKSLLINHSVDQVIELPRRAFEKTDAKAHIVILTKNGHPKEKVAINRLELDGTLSKTIFIPRINASQRMDYTYAENQLENLGETKFKISDVVVELARGQLSSTEVKISPIKIFHSTDFPEIKSQLIPKVPCEFVLTKSDLNNLKTAIAKKGDILICRVGRNLEKKICYVNKGYVALSDCVFRLQVKPKYVKDVLFFFTSSVGEKTLNALSHGVGAKHLSKQGLLNISVKTKNIKSKR